MSRFDTLSFVFLFLKENFKDIRKVQWTGFGYFNETLGVILLGELTLFLSKHRLNSSTRPLVHSSTRPLVHSSTRPLVHSSTRPLVHSSTRCLLRQSLSLLSFVVVLFCFLGATGCGSGDNNNKRGPSQAHPPSDPQIPLPGDKSGGPEAPVNLVPTPGNAQVTLTWEVLPGNPVTSYEYRTSRDGANTWTPWEKDPLHPDSPP